MNAEPMVNKDVLRAYLEANKRMQAEQTDGQIMPIAILNTFLGAALWGDSADSHGEPPTLEKLAEHLNISPQTLSTHLRYLGDKYRGERDGLNLVETKEYPPNRRQKTFRLTNRGKALAAQLAFLISGARLNGNHAEAS